MQQRPQETLRQLCELFPDFERCWKNEEAPPPEDGLVDGVFYQWTHHRVMQEFLMYFSNNHSSFTERQLRRFGDWVSKAVSVDSDLENAVSTCFLEHMRQLKINRVLAPYLSPVAKVKSHA
jgi:hypothetical protein